MGKKQQHLQTGGLSIAMLTSQRVYLDKIDNEKTEAWKPFLGEIIPLECLDWAVQFSLMKYDDVPR